MCEYVGLTRKQSNRVKKCSCGAPKRMLRLYSCCGSVQVYCYACAKMGPRLTDIRTGANPKDYMFADYMREDKGDSDQRFMVIAKWNTLIDAGVL